MPDSPRRSAWRSPLTAASGEPLPRTGNTGMVDGFTQDGTDGGNEVTAVGDEFAQTIDCFLRGTVQRRGHDHLVCGQAFGRRVGWNEIAFHVEAEQRIVDVAPNRVWSAS